MKTIYILVEGQTEERFVKTILYPYFLEKEKVIIPVIVETKRTASGIKHKGGTVSFEKAIIECRRLLKSGYVTTLFDYYGIKEDFNGYKESLLLKTIKEKKECIEKELDKEISNSKFIPYIQMHEFEALLFSDTSPFIYVNDDSSKLSNLTAEVNIFSTPEHVNNSKETAPSKRIKKYYSEYRKVSDGISIASEIGLDKIREKCLLFNEWIEKLLNI